MFVAVFFAAALAADPVPPAAPVSSAAPATSAVTVNSPYKNQAIQAKTAADAKTIVCRAEEATGSRLGAMRVCMTKEQWEERSQRDRQVLDDNQQRGFQH